MCRAASKASSVGLDITAWADEIVLTLDIADCIANAITVLWPRMCLFRPTRMLPGGAGSQLICITDCPIPLLSLLLTLIRNHAS
eukprot:COSAG02_NODE_26644_length_628_cov_1.030246_1_plen_83_part_01